MVLIFKTVAEGPSILELTLASSEAHGDHMCCTEHYQLACTKVAMGLSGHLLSEASSSYGIKIQ